MLIAAKIIKVPPGDVQEESYKYKYVHFVQLIICRNFKKKCLSRVK